MSSVNEELRLNTGASRSWNDLLHDDILKMSLYDFMAYIGKRAINPGGARGRERMLELLDPKPGSHILEIGGGSGHAACKMAKSRQCRVTTIDISSRSMKEAKHTVSRNGLSRRVYCETGDVHMLRFPDESFDYVVSQSVIMFVNQPRALAEVRRVLKKGGTFAGLEVSWKKDPPDDLREKTHRVCRCSKLDFHLTEGWIAALKQADFTHVRGSENPFGLPGIAGYLCDEGVINSLRIAAKVLSRHASMIRMAEIGGHFSRHAEYFSYTVFAGEKES
jgi:SAM-dependent methyltransferase